LLRLFRIKIVLFRSVTHHFRNDKENSKKIKSHINLLQTKSVCEQEHLRFFIKIGDLTLVGIVSVSIRTIHTNMEMFSACGFWHVNVQGLTFLML
jgi:hypothetical protein